MLGMIAGMHLSFLGYLGSCIWRHSTKTFFFTPRGFGRTAQLAALKFFEHMGTMSMSWGIIFEGVIIMNFFEKKIKNLFFGKNFKTYLLLQNKSHKRQTLHIC
jgi:hypothetical protein